MSHFLPNASLLLEHPNLRPWTDGDTASSANAGSLFRQNASPRMGNTTCTRPTILWCNATGGFFDWALPQAKRNLRFRWTRERNSVRVMAASSLEGG